MALSNDAPNRRFAAASYTWQLIALCAAVSASLVIGVAHVNAATTQIVGGVCNGGTRTPALVNVSPPTGNVVITNTPSLTLTTDWTNTVTIKKGSATLATSPTTYGSNAELTLSVTLAEGVNNLTITTDGGCPNSSTNTAYAITYIKNASTLNHLITNQPSPRLTGRYEPLGTNVFVTVDNTTYQAQANADGTWILPAGTITPELGENSYDIFIEQKDSSDVMVFSRTYAGALTIDTTAPLGSITTIEATTRSPELTGVVNDPDATVDVTVNGNTYTAINNRDGTWTLPSNTITPKLASGSYDVTVTLTDRAGNISTSTTTLTVKVRNEAGFILAPNTGYLRIGSVNIPSWLLYLAVVTLVLTIGRTLLRRRQKPAAV